MLEKLPLPPVLQLTRDQVKQLRNDNTEQATIQATNPSWDPWTVKRMLTTFSPPNMGSEPPSMNTLKSVYDILPMYIFPKGESKLGDGGAGPVSGKRRHGRDHVGGKRAEEEVRRMVEKSGIGKSDGKQ